jgi:hypothetical protein
MSEVERAGAHGRKEGRRRRRRENATTTTRRRRIDGDDALSLEF